MVRWRCGIALFFWLGTTGLAPASTAAPDCVPWPGEPSPLPTLDSDDPVYARWADLRVAELSALARRREEPAPVEAYLLWRRVLCLAPAGDEARAGVARTHPLRVHRPAIVVGGPTGAPQADPWLRLAMPVAVPAAVGAPPPGRVGTLFARERGRELARVRFHLTRADEALRSAHYEEALASATRARSRLSELRPGSDLREERIQLELVTATAHVALGDGEKARTSFARALAADPRLRLDPETTSPKVLRAFDAARAELATW